MADKHINLHCFDVVNLRPFQNNVDITFEISRWGGLRDGEGEGGGGGQLHNPSLDSIYYEFLYSFNLLSTIFATDLNKVCQFCP